MVNPTVTNEEILDHSLTTDIHTKEDPTHGSDLCSNR